MFRTSYDPKHFEAVILRRVYVQSDRAFLKNVFVTGKDNLLSLRDGLTAEEHKRLRRLAKEIKQNRGVVAKGKLSALLLLLGGVIIFTVFFKNALAERAGEQLLAAAFGARADISAVIFRPLRGSISFSNLTVADRDRPMKNLFELGPSRLAVDTWQLVRGHLIVDDATISSIEFGSARAFSGALEERAKIPANAGNNVTAPPSPVLPSLQLPIPSEQEVHGFLSSQWDALSVPDHLRSVTEDARKLATTWEPALREAEATLQEAENAAAALRELRPSEINSLDDATAAYRTISDAGARVADATEEARTSLTALVAEANALQTEAQKTPQLLQADLSALYDRIPRFSSGGTELLSRIIEPTLTDRLGATYETILRMYRIGERLQSAFPDKRRSTRRMPGEDIVYPTVRLPRVLIRRASLAMEDGEKGLSITGQLTNVADRQELAGGPTTFEFSRTGPSRAVLLSGMFDRRPDKAERIQMQIETAGWPFSLRQALPALDITAISGTYSARTGFVMTASGDAGGSIALTLSDPTVSGSYAEQSLGDLLAQTITGNGTIRAAGSYSVSNGSLSLSNFNTNLDEAMGAVLAGRIDQLSARYRQELKSQYDSQIEPILGPYRTALERITTLRARTEQATNTADDYESLIAQKKEAVDTRVAAIRKETERKVQSELQKKADSIRDKSNLPKLGF